MKKTILFIALCLCLMGFATGAFAENLLVNGDFEQLDESGFPIGWYEDAYFMENADTLYMLDENAYEGNNAAMIVSSDMNDARFAQTVSVEPESLYRLSGYIRANYMPDVGIGANLSVEGIYYAIDGFFDTEGDWKEFVVYGETGEEQTEITVFARLGGYGGESSGSASFDNLSLVKVDAVPGDEVAKLWFQSEEISSFSGTEVIDPIDEEQLPFTWALCAIGLLFIALFVLLLPNLKANLEDGNYTALFFVGLVVSVAVRYIIGYFVRGYEVDVNCFISWSNTMFKHGPSGFYQNTNFCDYVPGYLLILWFNGAVLNLTGQQWGVLVVKTVPILCDAFGALVIYQIGKKKIGGKPAMLLALLYAFNPAAIINSAAWGQVDSVMALVLLFVVICAMKHQWQYALPLYFVAVLLKPQALMFGPLGLAALIMDLVKNKKLFKVALIGLAAGLAAAAAIVLPFNGQQNISWLFAKYNETLSSYPHVTLNTANLYYLLGLNWVGVTQQVPVLTAVMLGLGMAVVSALPLIKRENRNKTSILIAATGGISALVLIFLGSGSYEPFGYVMMGVIIAICLCQYLARGDEKNLPLIGANMLLLIYVFGTKMHERYLFPALLLYALAYLQKRDWRILAVLVATTVTTFVNCGIILDNCLRLGIESGHLLAENYPMGVVLSIINIAAALLSAWICNDLMVLKKEPKSIEGKSLFQKSVVRDVKSPVEDALLSKKDNHLNMAKRDYIIMLGVTVLYSLLVLCNLGSVKAPQTAYVTESAEDIIVFDLGEETTFRMLYYAQVSYDRFGVCVSDDNVSWSEEYLAQMAQGECFRWKYLTTWFTNHKSEVEYRASDRVELIGRYVKILPRQADLKLCEVIFRDIDGNRIEAFPVTESAAVLLDEQDTLQGEPSWYNSTYFDEIYHARTAFEHANGIFPYETTHPPLGKVIMSWFVGLFGMTPFIWRFAGALMGILMLPAMYLLGKQLFKKTNYATVAMLLMTLDCMHLTQTRIATIDSFPVLFIIFAYFFMLRYMQTDVWEKGLIKSCIPLLFSGLFMGLAIASKWIGIYAGVGLALLFFYTSIQHIRQYKAAVGLGLEDISKKGFRQVAFTWLLCILFFIVIPLVIYYASYIPYFAPDGGVTVEKVIEAAIGKDYGNGVRSGGMLGYHSTPNLGMDHPFYSPWYEWPLILKPMYYASDNYVPQGYAYSVFCIGNPAVWWAGIIGLAYVFFAWIKRHIYNRGNGLTVHLRAYDNSLVYGFLLIGFLSQYLPWVLVPRGTYIYHYFASVPFIILCTVALLKLVTEKLGKKGTYIMWGYVVVCGVCFIILYPYASGITMPTGWLDFAKNLMIRRNIYY